MRDPLDRYYTPDEVAAAVVGWLRIPPAWTVVEPSVGSGAWVRALRAAGHTGRIIGVDIDPQAAGLELVDEAHVGDWTELAPRVGAGAQLHIGNPPFGPMVDHIEASLAVCDRAVTLARGTFVELTKKRLEFWRRRTPVIEWTIGDRISFSGPVDHGGRTDSICHSMLFWRSTKGKISGWHREVVSVEHDIAPARRIRWQS